VTHRYEIDVARERTNCRINFVERFKKGIRIRGFWSKCRNPERMRRIELRKELFRRIELFNGKNECVEHPRIGRTHILRLILKSCLQRKAARREHSRVINRFRE